MCIAGSITVGGDPVLLKWLFYCTELLSINVSGYKEPGWKWTPTYKLLVFKFLLSDEIGKN